MDVFYPNAQPPSLAYTAAVPDTILQSCHSVDLLYDNPVVSGGFLYNFDGETYYSPNCRRVNLELPPKVESSNDGVIQGRDYDIQHFQKPQWWTTPHGYLAFLPLRPDLSSPPLYPLLRIPKVLFDPSTRRFYPSPAVWHDWKELQAKIALAVHLLIFRSGAPAVRPAYPCARVDNKTYKGPGGKHNLKEDIFDALSWFSVWFACLAYTIAVSEAVDRATRKAGYRTVPKWMEILASDYISEVGGAPKAEQNGKDGLDGRFVSSLPNSCLASFDDTVERVGTFVSIPDDDRPIKHGMVSIDWLCEFKVPVWYRWGPREIAIAEKNPFWKRYAPPTDAVIVPTGTPGPTEETVLPITSEPPIPRLSKELFQPFRRRAEPVDKPWEAWFKEREVRNASIIPNQSQAARSRRLNWMHNPPTNPKKTKFFVWDKNEDGVFRRRKAREDDLEDLFQPDGTFSRSQARYDAVSNEWDLCEFFAPADDARLQHLAELDAEYRGTTVHQELEIWKIHYGIIPEPDVTPTASKKLPTGAEPVARAAQEDVHMVAETQSTTEIPAAAVPCPSTDPDVDAWDPLPEQPSFVASRFFGYVEPLAPLSIPSPPLSASFVPKVLGLGKTHSTRDVLWSTASGQQLISFFHALAKGKPASDLWDLSRYNRTPVASLPRFKQVQSSLAQCLVQEVDWNNNKGRIIRTVQEPRSTFWFPTDHGQRWRLGCLSPVTALTICRWDNDMDFTAIAFSFIGLGIQFQTWQEVSDLPDAALTTRPCMLSLLSYRNAIETFGSSDYDHYLHQVPFILNARPGAARAAVMRGGIVGRLCISHVSTDDILRGPSQAALEGRGIVRSDGNGGFLVDDALQVEEVDAICGHIDQWNSQDNQITRVSWWPPADLWEERYGFTGWSSDAEDFYHGRLSEIKRTWKPLPRSEWRKRLRQSSTFRALLASVERHALDIIGHSLEGGL